MSITPLIGMEDERIVLNVSRPSSKAILNGEIRYCKNFSKLVKPIELSDIR
nr:hypothetical protein [uncultured Mediterraneibacter sp.]